MAGRKALGREYRAHRPLILDAGRRAAVIISLRLRRTRDAGQVCPRVSEVPGHQACRGTFRAHLPLAAEPLGFPQGGLDTGHGPDGVGPWSCVMRARLAGMRAACAPLVEDARQ